MGARMGLAVPKQYLRLGGRTLLELAAEALTQDQRVERVLVVVAAADEAWRALRCAPGVQVVADGGATRAETVRNGLARLHAAPDDWVLVHDAARPCLSAEDLAALIDTLWLDPVGGLLAVPLADTLKRAAGERVAATLPRESLWRAATPQMFRAGLLARALSGDLEAITDEAAAVERLGEAPRLVEGASSNIKLTQPGDEILARAVLQAQGRLA
ncbi:MAG: 2-C-methyl-D-erythritol 4-phosphate cytidylyltransferase [Betaproteobacteria bacterium]